MAVHDISEEQRDRIVERMINVLGLERKHPTKQELEEEIIDYLGKKHPCALGTCGKDGIPRISMVDYMNDGLTLHIMSEGGDEVQKHPGEQSGCRGHRHFDTHHALGEGSEHVGDGGHLHR